MSNLNPNFIQQTLHHYQPTLLDTPKKASVAMVICWDQQPSFLFMKRAAHPNDPWSGHVSFPGGKREVNETSLHTAIRETEEELGFQLNAKSRLGALSDLQAIGRGKLLGLSITPEVFALDRRPTITPSADEVDSYFWVPLEFFKTQHVSEFDYSYKGIRHKLPCLDFENEANQYRIWGLTYRMLQQFFAVIGRPFNDR